MDADKIKNFFIFHCEKMVVAVVVGLSAFLIYSGMGMPLILSEKQPDKLTEDAQTVRRSIDDDHNENVLAERDPTFDIVARTERRNQPVPADLYPLPYAWEQKNVDGSIRRTDPVLSVPRELKMYGVVTQIAVRSPGAAGTYPLQDLEPADAAVVVEKVKPVKKPSKRELRMMEMSGMGGMDGMDGMDPYGMDMGMGMDEMYDMGGSMSAGAGRTLDAKFNFGVTPETTASGQKPIPEIASFIAGTALMPHKEMFESFELAFKNADGYLPLRDIPLYYNLELQRADVTGRTVAELTDKDWAMRGNRALYLQYARGYWAGYGKEVVPGEYRDLALTTYIPPVLLDDPMAFTLHPKIPMTVKKDDLGAQRPKLKDGADLMLGGADGPMVFAAPGAAGAGMGMGMDYSMDPMGMGMDMGMGMGMLNQKPVDYKLIRFYDFQNGARDANPPRAGRQYVYRIRVAIMDPNFPMNPAIQPRNSSLASDVYQRVADLTLAAEKAGDRIKGMLFERWTDWSAPSDPVSLPDMTQYFAGPIKPGAVKTATVGNRTVLYTRDEPSFKIVATQFDRTYKTRIPLVMNVTEGSVLSAKGLAEPIDPITRQIKKLPDAEITSGTTVIDIEGGQPIEISPGEDMTQPGVMLLFDEDGGLTVTDEVSDQEFYRIYSYADERGE